MNKNTFTFKFDDKDDKDSVMGTLSLANCDGIITYEGVDYHYDSVEIGTVKYATGETTTDDDGNTIRVKEKYDGYFCKILVEEGLNQYILDSDLVEKLVTSETTPSLDDLNWKWGSYSEYSA